MSEKRFPCKQCGAKLVFAPATAMLRCEHCGYENPIPQSEEQIQERDFSAHLLKLAEQQPTEEHTTLKCSACAAEIEKEAHVTALQCPYCDADIVATQNSRRLIKAESLLPFKVKREEALSAFRAWLKGLWFAPNKLKQYATRQSRLNGMYIPHWTYDCYTTSYYSGMRGRHYYVTVGSGKNRRTERRTRWYPASGVVFRTFDDVVIAASDSLPQKYLVSLEPWDLANLVSYGDAYLSGFRAESYQVDLVEGFERAKQVMEGPIHADVRMDIGGDAQIIHSVKTQYDNVTFKHILLPVWVSAYRFRQKVYRFLVNARTGEVQGERPWSWIKITLAVLTGLLLCAAVGYLIAQSN